MKITTSDKYTARQILRWLWQAWRGNRLQATLNALLGVADVVLSLAQVWAVKHAIDVASGSDRGSIHWAVGIGAKYKINERMNVGVDWSIHFSLSDELDGVKDPYGIKSSGLWKNQDCYSMLQVSFTYSFSAKCKTCNKEE